MEIKIINSVEEADQAKGLAVVIDVFRAFSTEAYLFANGAKKIIPILNLDEAYSLKKLNPDFILMGERNGLKQKGFDYGNSPGEVKDVDFSGKTIIHTTSNGTKGLLNAKNADIVLVGSFLMAGSIIKFIKLNDIKSVFLVSTSHDVSIENEDIIFAQYIKDILEGNPVDELKIKEMIKDVPAYTNLFEELNMPITDFDLCMDFNKFDFVIKKVIEDGQLYLIREDVL